ncbi:D-alanyl-D-alanine carboxypeptidase [Rubellimicrobium roseum]|uniref:D-alanyl-D-alanine carboxypeptidase n=2 Tax=Rubellimicrobium roseum TaxID=687525 RepID=A0A5C4N9N8_9RHOB|nr:D-alanyl-D-alanine carboxypeptidase family protein [Rubellimicrobium roseum]TNC63920.1 D-alanyl-D-alanine carboxypeptidase [Rubellimicrobium roseum]
MAAQAAPFAAFVMDARTGQIFYEENAETPLHPASLTKMMTIYLAFQAIQRGEITLDTVVRIPADAADEPPSRLGLRPGQEIKLRYLLRAAAVKSANDAATAIGYAISGSEEAFAARMNAMAQAMGMTHTHFRNMNGLTEEGHYSTARDMSILGRHMIYDYPQYYNLFSRRTADAGMAQVNNTNRRFLDAYEGADGIKTGFTNAAGYNLVASAQRGDVRIIATVFGGTSTADRNARISRLLDMGFDHAPAQAQVVAVDPPVVTADDLREVAANTDAAPTAPVAPDPGRVSGPIETSLRPQPRPGSTVVAFASGVKEEEIEDALAQALAAPPEPATEIIMTAAAIDPAKAPLLAEEPEVVTRFSTSGGSLWGINLGSYPSRDAAERALIQVALAESSTLDGGLRRVVQRSGGFDGNIMGLTRDEADLACRRLQARNTTCFMIGTEE